MKKIDIAIKKDMGGRTEKQIIRYRCPSEYGMVDSKKLCPGNNGPKDGCTQCWNKESRKII